MHDQLNMVTLSGEMWQLTINTRHILSNTARQGYTNNAIDPMTTGFTEDDLNQTLLSWWIGWHYKKQQK